MSNAKALDEIRAKLGRRREGERTEDAPRCMDELRRRELHGSPRGAIPHQSEVVNGSCASTGSGARRRAWTLSSPSGRRGRYATSSLATIAARLSGRSIYYAASADSEVSGKFPSAGASKTMKPNYYATS